MAKQKESFIRWQAITIEQLGYAINLILAFATASLGFSLTEIKSGDLSGRSKCLLAISIISFVVSIGFGVWCVINRLLDFKKTKDIARDREDWVRDNVDDAEIDKRLEGRRAKTKTLGRRTWILFYFQIGVFAFGILVLTIATSISYLAKP